MAQIGRPPKRITITEALRAMLLETIEVPGKGEVPAAEVAAKMIRELLFYGRVTLLDGEQYSVPFDEWISTYKWLTLRIDGRPPVAASDSGAANHTILVLPAKEMTDDAAIITEAERRAARLYEEATTNGVEENSNGRAH